MNLLANRQKTADDDALKGKFIRRALTETSRSIAKAVDQKTAGFKSGFWNARTITVTDSAIEYSLPKQLRYLDMRTRQRQDGNKTRKKSQVVHNRIIFGNYSQLIRELSFGYTEAIKNEIRNLNE